MMEYAMELAKTTKFFLFWMNTERTATTSLGPPAFWQYTVYIATGLNTDLQIFLTLRSAILRIYNVYVALVT